MSSIVRYILEVEAAPEDFEVGKLHSDLASMVGRALDDTQWDYTLHTEIVERN